MIELVDVSKTYNNSKGISKIDLQFEPGKIYALIGRNGSGKSTIMNLIANRIFKDSGEVKINDNELNSNTNISKDIYLLSESNYYNKNIEVLEHYKYIETVNSQFDYDEAIKLSIEFGLDVNARLRGLSKGFLVIFNICVALSMDVDYLLLDEPVDGLDASHRKLFYKKLLEYYQQRSNTIVISSHIIDELTNLIEKVCVIENGQIIMESEVSDLLSSAYLVSGKHDLVKEYLKNTNPVLIERGEYNTKAYVLHFNEKSNVEGVKISKLSLQDLSVVLTNERSRYNGKNI